MDTLKYFKSFGPGLLVLGLIVIFWIMSQPVEFESLESKTETGLPVYNRIQYYAGITKDIWVMQQHHVTASVPTPAHEKWDKVAIVVEKWSGKATFYQLAPGDNVFDEKTLKQPLKVRCFACHSNGPRAIRPNETSPMFAIGPFAKAQLVFLNARIKSYGHLESKSGSPGDAPFRSPLKVMSRSINLKSCNRCHSENGIRAPLLYEHLGTIDFMVKSKLMPPWPFEISARDKKAIEL